MHRQQYMQAYTDCGNPVSDRTKACRELIHHNYYLQFSSPALEKLVIDRFGLDRLKEAYATDKNLNNIPLQQWDDLFPIFQRLVDRQKIKELGEGMSLSTCVCTLKNIAVFSIYRSDEPVSAIDP